VCISADSKYIISGSGDKSIKIWNIEGNLIKSINKVHDDIVNSVCISADSKYIISGSEDKSIKIWNIEGNLIKSIDNVHDYGV
jgi:WD40 repeat protein